MSNLPSILSRLEALEGADREVDVALHRALFPDDEYQRLVAYHRYKRDPLGDWREIPRYTSSLDAIVSLIEAKLPAHQNCVDQTKTEIRLTIHESGAIATLNRDTFGGEHTFDGHAPTAPLALAQALIKALIHLEEGKQNG